MSWSGTVTCSYCYKQGHNKRKCPALSERIKSEYEGAVLMVEEARAKGNENDAKWYGERAEGKRQEYIKRTKIDLATGEKVTNKAAKAERMKKVKCGYCGDYGHTRRSCPAVKEDYEVFKVLSKKYRQAAYDKLRELNVNIGSMVFNRRWQNGEYQNHIYLVTAFDMSAVDYHDQDAKCVKETSPQGHGDIWLTPSQMDSLIARGKAHASASPVTLKPNALDGVKLIKEAFPTSDERPYRYGRYGEDEAAETREALGYADTL